ncbi:MAG: endonuclease/exonuclease/phosphatase family protein [Hyphomicrobiales bacterium]
MAKSSDSLTEQEIESGTASKAPLAPKNDWRRKIKAERPPMSAGLLVLCIIGLCVSLILIAIGFLGGVWIPLDAVSHLRIHLMGAAVGFALAIFSLLTLRRKRYAFLILVLAAAGTVLFAARWPEYSQPKVPPLTTVLGEKALRLVSLNIWGRNGANGKIADAITQADADVAVLLEYLPKHKPLLDRLLESFPHQYDCAEIAGCTMAIVSKHPFEQTGGKARWEGPVTVWARFGKELNGVTVFGTHFLRPDTPNAQWRQVKALARETFNAPGPLIVTGDFNAAPGSLMLVGFQEFAGLWRVTSLPTWPAWFFNLPQLAIDHMYISGGVRPLALPETGQNAGSDHLSQIGVFAISGQAQ